jgi:hypothetical protein
MPSVDILTFVGPFPTRNLATVVLPTYDVVEIPWEVKQLDTQSAAVFTNLIKEESYHQFEARAMLLGEKGTGNQEHSYNTCGILKTTDVDFLSNSNNPRVSLQQLKYMKEHSC